MSKEMMEYQSPVTHLRGIRPLRFEAQNRDKTLYVSEVSISGEYRVSHTGSSWEVYVRGRVVAREHTSEKAMNAAQAHHVDRVLSAFEDPEAIRAALASEGQADE